MRMTFRGSSCGRFVVSMIGDSIRVLTVDEAQAIATLYREKQAEMETVGRIIMAEHEKEAADAIERGLAEAADNRLADRRPKHDKPQSSG